MKQEINSKSKTGKFTNVWKLNCIPLNNQWGKEEITKEIRKYLEINENEICHEKGDAAKSALMGSCIAINTYIQE